MSAKITFDLAAFQAGLRHKLALPKKAEAEVINEACGSIVANAIKLTPKAAAAKIKAELRKNKLAIYATIRRLKKAGISHRGMSRARFAAEVEKTIALRARSGGYIAAGWFKALAVFRPGSKRKVSEKGLAAKGTGKKATPSDLVGEMTNYARGAGKVGVAALQQALDQEGKFMLGYGSKKLKEALK